MKQALAYIGVAIVAAGIAWGSGYHAGCLDEHSRVWNEAHQAAQARYDAQKRQDDRVNRIVKEAQYKEGFNSCQEQF